MKHSVIYSAKKKNVFCKKKRILRSEDGVESAQCRNLPRDNSRTASMVRSKRPLMRRGVGDDRILHEGPRPPKRAICDDRKRLASPRTRRMGGCRRTPIGPAAVELAGYERTAPPLRNPAGAERTTFRHPPFPPSAEPWRGSRRCPCHRGSSRWLYQVCHLEGCSLFRLPSEIWIIIFLTMLSRTVRLGRTKLTLTAFSPVADLP